MNKKSDPKTNAKHLMSRIAEGLLGWFYFKQAEKNSRLYSEYYFYEPIFQIARGHDQIVYCQKKMRKRKKAGAPPSIDFLFYDKNSNFAIAVEVKFRRSTKSHVLNISDAISKLASFTVKDFRKLNGSGECHLYKYILLLGYEENLQRITGEDTKIRKQLARVHDGIKPSNLCKRPRWTEYGLARSLPKGTKTKQICAIILSEQPWWKNINAK